MSAFERLFKNAKSITTTTSNNHPDDVIGNIMLRSQVALDGIWMVHLENHGWKSMHYFWNVRENEIKEKYPHSLWFYQQEARWMAGTSWEYFWLFVMGRNVSWKDTPDYEFFDEETDYISVQLHHFREWSSREEEEYLEKKWKECLQNTMQMK